MVREFLLDFTYSSAQIKKILEEPCLREFRDETLLGHIKDVVKLLGEYYPDKDDVKKITSKDPSLFAYDYNTLKNKIVDIEDLGFELPLCLKMVKLYPTILTLGIDNIKGTIQHFMMEDENEEDRTIPIAFTIDEVIKMLVSFPSLVGYSIERIDARIGDLLDLDYAEDQVKVISLTNPQIFSYSLKKITDRLEDFQKFDYSEEEARIITSGYAKIFGYSNESFESKVGFFIETNLKKHLIRKPFSIVPSTELAILRMKYLHKQGIEITEANCSIIFAGDDKFKKKYHVTREEMVKFLGDDKRNEISS